MSSDVAHRRWKTLQLLGSVMIIAGLPTCAVGTFSQQAGGSILGLGAMIALLGLAANLCARVWIWNDSEFLDAQHRRTSVIDHSTR